MAVDIHTVDVYTSMNTWTKVHRELQRWDNTIEIKIPISKLSTRQFMLNLTLHMFITIYGRENDTIVV